MKTETTPVIQATATPNPDAAYWRGFGPKLRALAGELVGTDALLCDILADKIEKHLCQ